MKKIVYYALLMTLTVSMLPFLIVKGCSRQEVRSEPRIQQITKESIKIKVYMNDEQKVVEMSMEEYLKGVVAAEMPAEFEPEALKAQAVAARTYAYAKSLNLSISEDGLHNEADVCTDFAHCQAWISKENAMKGWESSSASGYWDKIESAVKDTQGVVITYEGQVIDEPLFHSNSGGKTENVEEVFSNQVPYLRSVVSLGEDAASEYKDTASIKIKDFCSKLKSAYPGIKINEKDPLRDIKILEYSEGGRVKTIKAGNMTLKGTDIRSLFSLKSTNFTIEKGTSDTLKFTTTGNGHGVGMSQWGANYLARNGGSCEEILKYYYKGVELETIYKDNEQ